MLVLINPQKMVQKYSSFQKQFNSNNFQIKEANKFFSYMWAKIWIVCVSYMYFIIFHHRRRDFLNMWCAIFHSSFFLPHNNISSSIETGISEWFLTAKVELFFSSVIVRMTSHSVCHVIHLNKTFETKKMKLKMLIVTATWLQQQSNCCLCT